MNLRARNENRLQHKDSRKGAQNMNSRGIRAFLLALFFFLTLPSPVHAEQADPPPGRRRALLIGCDHFLSQEDTWPAADNNVRLLAETLQHDTRRYTLIRAQSSQIATVDAFEQAVQEAFANATENDVSLLYISTHGVFDERQGNANAALLLSDGQHEEALTAQALQEMLDPIPGIKVLILDFCNSGAFIGKGLSGGASRVLFSGPEYKVLCSAGGSEASWYWQTNGENASTNGASYFANVLADALGNQGDYAADANLDGDITLTELYDFMLDNYAASTAQAYPQQDAEFVLFAYDPQAPQNIRKAVTDIAFEDTVLVGGESSISFSFTVQRQTMLYYQIVYHKDGAWQFTDAQQFLDNEQSDGSTLPGRKARTLSLSALAADQYGYAMIQLITVQNGVPHLEGARLLCVQPSEAEVHLAVVTNPSFMPGIGQELCILVQHDVPCGLTVSIRDADGGLVARLCYDAASRPQQLSPAASTFYWNGMTRSNTPAPDGEYTVEVSAEIGGIRYTAKSMPFSLISPLNPPVS